MRYETDEFPALKRAKKFEKLATGGDFGGTKSRLALVGSIDGKIETLLKVSWLTTDISSIEKVFSEYRKVLKDYDIDAPKDAVLGCAGLIRDKNRYCKLTNNDVEISSKDLEKEGFDVLIINDFLANAFGVPILDLKNEDEVIELNHSIKSKGKGIDSTTKLVLGPGTGLGVGVIYNGMPRPSEGGHIGYSPMTELEWRLKQFLQKKLETIDPDVETVASGIGMWNIFDYFINGEMPREGVGLHIANARAKPDIQKFYKEIKGLEPKDAGREIGMKYRKEVTNYHEILEELMKTFVHATAAAARDSVHEFLAYEGVYLAGGNARRLEKVFKKYFMDVFDNSYKFADDLRAVPVYLIRSRVLGTTGAGFLALQEDKKKYLK
jgi:glucokinase